MPRRRTAAERDENNIGAMYNLAVLLALQKRDLNEGRQLVEKAIEIERIRSLSASPRLTPPLDRPGCTE
jgi:hypothetical protein